MTPEETRRAWTAWQAAHPVEAAVIRATYLQKTRQGATHGRTYLITTIAARLQCSPYEAAHLVRV